MDDIVQADELTLTDELEVTFTTDIEEADRPDPIDYYRRWLNDIL